MRALGLKRCGNRTQLKVSFGCFVDVGHDGGLKVVAVQGASMNVRIHIIFQHKRALMHASTFVLKCCSISISLQPQSSHEDPFHAMLASPINNIRKHGVVEHFETHLKSSGFKFHQRLIGRVELSKFKKLDR